MLCVNRSCSVNSSNENQGFCIPDLPVMSNRLNLLLQAGYTLMELVIVVLFLGIMVMAAVPVLNSGLDDARLSGAAGEIVTALEFAQMTAATSGSRTRVTIDAALNTIVVEKFSISFDLLGSENELYEDDVEGGDFALMERPMNRGVDYSISLPDESRFNGIDITAAAFGAGNFVVFDTLGAPSDGGTVTLAMSNRQIVVALDSLAGKVTLSH